MKIEDTIWLLAHSTDPEDRREWAVLYWKSQGLKHEEIAEKWGYSIKWVQRYMTRAYKRFEVPPELNKYEKLRYLEENVFPLMRKFIANEPDIVKELPAPPEEPEQGVVISEDNFEEEIDDDETSEDLPIIEIRPPKQLPAPKDPWKTFRRVFFTLVSVFVVSIVGYYAYNLGRQNTTEPQIVVITATFPPATDTLIPSATSSIPTNTSIPTSTSTQQPTNTSVPTEFIPPADGILFEDDFETGDISAWTQVNGK